jgi:LytS/YehU family sensor histidine kinase
MQIPPFLVQSLVENAVKHGRATSSFPLRVRLSTVQEENTLRIRVENTGRLAPAPAGNGHGGIGLKNIRERLQRLYPDRHGFTLQEEDGWVQAEVIIQQPDPGQDGEGRMEENRFVEPPGLPLKSPQS